MWDLAGPSEKGTDEGQFLHRTQPQTNAFKDGYTPVVTQSAPELDESIQPQWYELKNIRFLRWYDRHFKDGWRGSMLRVAIFSTSSWFINIIVYIALYTTFDVYHGSGVLMESSCDSVKRANTGIHAALNIVTSLMLSASTFAMESLCCPTREEVDVAHAENRWLGVGGLSLRNFRFITKTRSVLWVLLWITSIPLHLFFNAVFFTSSAAHQYAVAVVTPDFFTNATWIPTIPNSAPGNFDALGGYAERAEYERSDNQTVLTLLYDARRGNNPSNFTTLNPDQCMSLYANGFLQRASDVVVVTDSNSQSSPSPLIWTRYPERSINHGRNHSNQDPFNWICHDALQQKVGEEARGNDRCILEVVQEIIDQPEPWTVYGHKVQYCLSRPYYDQCSLLYNVWIMLAVLVFGFIKTITIIWICVRHGRTRNLRTLGDAVSSFLEKEDNTTKDLCLIQSSTFVKHGLRSWEPQRCTGAQQRWWLSAGVKQFWVTIAMTIIYAILLGIALDYAIEGAFGTAFDSAFGEANIQALAMVGKDDADSSGIIPLLLIANIPQVAFSVLYMAYNDLFAKIHMAVDFNRHHQEAVGLRISERPQGAQRETRFFNLRVHWYLSIVGTSALLHWLASQALFTVRVDGVDNQGVVDRDDQLTRLGYNCRAIVAMICVLLAIAVSTVCIGWFRRFDVGFGEMGNSLVISAACHPPENWKMEGDMALKPLSWGDVTMYEDGQEATVRHCSFAPMQPRKLVVGAYYS